ncbi:MAG: heavy-metal-associated domain-containing protein [Chloroflexi bacterium]|nr:heavy-metal-associated domain-containing protein [Chloroflexota bacterium]
MSKVVLDVPEISCAHCSQAITQALQPQAGVEKVRVDVPSRKVYLDYDENTISIDKVKALLAEEEYPVANISNA